MKETKEFQTESKELLNLMVNSIYSNNEIFLRELISNASDAIDKYKFTALKSEGNLEQRDYQIFISCDKDARTLTIKDNGIGMSKEDLENNLGTIARSGSKDFVAKFKEAKESENMNIIGQFGVGFYSAFMVASKIEVLTKKANEQAYLFTSDGVDTYTIEDAESSEEGTSITLYLKEDTEDEKYSRFLEQYEIQDLVRKYSDYIRYPIKMNVKTTKPKLDEEGKEIEGQTEEVIEERTLNSMVPLWKKNKKDVTDEELASFYKDKFGEWEDPFTSLFINVDGMISYNALIFIPSHAPYNLYSENYEKGLDLYAKGVFIKEKCKELVPDYLKFIKGLVDSDDFSLNISREILQNSPMLRRIQDNIESKVINKLKDIKNDNFDKYLEFYKIYGDNLKYGIYSSYGSKTELLKDLILFNSLNSEKMISLKDYKDSIKEDQKVIYYATGKSLASIKLLPQIEKFKKDGIDVLLLDHNIDEFALQMMREYDGLSFKSISEENKQELNEEEKSKINQLVIDNKRLIDDLSEALKGKVDEVSFSTRLVESPVCITTKDGLSLNMEHVLNEEQQAASIDESERVKARKVLEINPDHQLFKAIASLNDDEKIKKYGSLLYEEAMMLEGYDVKDKNEFVKTLNELMIEALNK